MAKLPLQSTTNLGTLSGAHDFSVEHAYFTEVHGNVNHYYNPTPPTSILPLPPLKHSSTMFMGRNNYLDKLKECFGHSATGQRQLFLLYGMGGIGKTQICLKFIEQNGQLFSHIFWIDASSEYTIDLTLRQIAQEHNVISGSIVSAGLALKWISQRANWLIIYDGADGEHDIVEKYLPPGSTGNILITSRNSDLQRITLTKNSLEVSEMGEEEAVLLLLESASLDGSSDHLRLLAKQLVVKMGGIPLALDQAGSYIKTCACSIEDYLETYSKHQKEALSRATFKGASNYEFSTYGTWEISMQEIEARAAGQASPRAVAAQSAITLVNIFPFLHHTNIPEELFKHAAENYVKRVPKEETESLVPAQASFFIHCAEIAKFFKNATKNIMKDKQNSATKSLPISVTLLDSQTLFLNEKGEWDRMKFMEGIHVLASFSLIRRNNTQFSMHPLVHLWSIDRVPQTKIETYYWKARALLSCSVEPDYDIDNHAICQLLAPHVQSNCQHGLDMKMKARYYDDEHERFALVFDTIGDWDQEEQLLLVAVSQRCERLGSNHPETLLSMSNLAMIYSSQGRWNEAEKLQLDVMDACKAKFGSDHPNTLTSINNLAATYSSQGRWNEAQKLQLHVIDASKAKLGSDHSNTLRSMNNLAMIYNSQGRWNEAQELQLHVMEASEAKLQSDHPDTLMSTNNLAMIYSSQGRWNEAEQLQLDVMDASKAKLGSDHLNTLMSMSNLAAIYSSQGRWNEAEKLQLDVVDGYTKLGSDHPDTLRSMNNLAMTYNSQGRWNEAQKLQLDVMNAYKAKLGLYHPDTLMSMNNLAMTYSSQGRWNEAEKLQLDVMNAYKAKLGPDHSDTLIIMSNLAIIYMSQERWNEAEMLQLDVMNVRRAGFGSDHPDTLTGIAQLAIISYKQGRWSEAELMLSNAIESMQQAMGTHHPTPLMFTNILDELHQEKIQDSEDEDKDLDWDGGQLNGCHGGNDLQQHGGHAVATATAGNNANVNPEAEA